MTQQNIKYLLDIVIVVVNIVVAIISLIAATKYYQRNDIVDFTFTLIIGSISVLVIILMIRSWS